MASRVHSDRPGDYVGNGVDTIPVCASAVLTCRHPRAAAVSLAIMESSEERSYIGAARTSTPERKPNKVSLLVEDFLDELGGASNIEPIALRRRAISMIVRS